MMARGETTSWSSAEGASSTLRISQAKELLFDAALESASIALQPPKGKSLNRLNFQVPGQRPSF